MTSRKILVVDDDASTRRATVRILEREGYAVSEAADGGEALSQVRERMPDLVLLDMMLPDLPGTEVLGLIKADVALSSISVVFLSGMRTSGAEQSGGLDAGADGYIARPLSNDELLARVRTHVRQIDLTRALRAAESRYRELVESQADAVIVIDGEGVIRFANPASSRLFGRPAERLLGEAFGNPLDRGDHREIEVPRSGAPTMLAEMRSAPTVWEGLPSTIVTLRDVTERRRAEELAVLHAAQIESAFLRTVELVTNLTEMRDPYTVGHERRVAGIAVAIGAALGLDERSQEGLRVAGHLHDVGKICVPAEILARPARLSPVEYQMVQRHVEVGHDLLADIESSWPLARITVEHHERLDGSGYPNGLMNGEILLESRIMAVADVVEAMSSHRPYRPAHGIDAALSEIERGRGTVYDEDAASACLDLFRNRGFSLPS